MAKPWNKILNIFLALALVIISSPGISSANENILMKYFSNAQIKQINDYKTDIEQFINIKK